MSKCKIKSCKEPISTFPNPDIGSDYCLQHGINKAIKLSMAKEKLEKQKQSKEKAEKKIELMSADEYCKTFVQPLINEIVRLIDKDCPCISSGNTKGKFSAGHFYNSNDYPSIRLNLHNLHIQSFHANNKKNGDLLRYRQGLFNTYGNDYLIYVEGLNQIKQPKYSKSDLMVIKEKASLIRTELRKANLTYSPSDRIKLRTEINNKLFNI